MSNLDIIRGRQLVAPLTNKSGGSVASGDVVVIDITTDDSFTTTTSGSIEQSIGVAQETIADDAEGRVLLAGYAPLVNVNASATRGHYLKTHTVAKQATSVGTRAAGAFGQVLTAGTSPTAWIWGVADQTASGSAGGGGIVGYDIERYTGGDISVSSAVAGTAMSGPGDIVVAASTGDLLSIGVSALANSDADTGRLDAASVVSAALTNYISSQTSTPASTGVGAWFMYGSTNTPIGGTVPYAVQAGDIDGGNVTLRLCAWMSSGARTVQASSNAPLVFWVINHGQP